MLWFSSDSHFSHNNIIKYSNRPFSTVEEMNNTIIDRLNEKVKPDDSLYLLGDFMFGVNSDIDKIYKMRDRINCNWIHYILGNHDKAILKYRDQLVRDQVFIWIKDYAYINARENPPIRIALMHYAMRVWDKMHYGTYHLYGHSHGNLPEDPASLSFDVGVDTNNFYPYSLDDVIERMSHKQFKPIDHHGDENRGKQLWIRLSE